MEIIDVPFKNIWPGNAGNGKKEATEGKDVAEGQGGAERKKCVARHADGTACRFLALPGRVMCPRHDRWYADITNYMRMPYPEDAIALQDVMAQIMVLILKEALDLERAKVVVQLCQVMQRNLKQYQYEVREAEIEEQRWTRCDRVIG